MKWIASSMAIALLCGCIVLTVEPRAVVSGPGRDASVTSLRCDAVGPALQAMGAGDAAGALDRRRPLRVLIWNIHKQGDSGWQRDLAAFAATHDVMLLQETVLQTPLRDILDDAGLRWVMASSFQFDSDDMGVLTASRIAPIASCTQRMVEPLIRLPKSAVVSWLPVASMSAGTSVNTPGGLPETLAIANVHSINFELSLHAYRAQIEALADALASHRGPIIFAGDFNTWNDAREQVVAATATRLGLTELHLRDDRRAVFFGRHLDHIFVRGLQTIDLAAVPVTSSDHNPISATLRIP